MDHYLRRVVMSSILSAMRVGGEHQSEKAAGEWSRERGTRDQIVLSTKGEHPKLESMDVPRLSKAEIQEI
jgi:aryl-alcohol dehydrogenase-like predicted oxidoreductase